MPKRRMTPARRRQIKQWQAASHKRGIPHGKTLTLFHGTNPVMAQKILKQGFTNPTGVEFFSRRRHGKGQGAFVKVRVPYKKITKLGHRGLYSVTVKNLTGRKISA